MSHWKSFSDQVLFSGKKYRNSGCSWGTYGLVLNLPMEPVVSLRARRAETSAQNHCELILKFLISSSNCLAWTSRWVTSSRSLRISSCCR